MWTSPFPCVCSYCGGPLTKDDRKPSQFSATFMTSQSQGSHLTIRLQVESRASAKGERAGSCRCGLARAGRNAAGGYLGLRA